MESLENIAARLDMDETLYLRYRMLVNTKGREEWMERVDRILDVAEDRGIIYVQQDGQPVWIGINEAVEVLDSSIE